MRIGIDVDSVLADIMEPLLDFFNKRKNTNLILEDIKDFNIEKSWNISLDESVKLVEDFFNECFNRIIPIEGSIENVKLLKEKGHELFIVTARPTQFKEKTIQWLKETYGENSFSEFFFNDLFRYPNAKLKSSVMITNNLDILIDDDIRNYKDCQNNKISCILLNVDNKFPWARVKKDEDFENALSWYEAVEKINSLILVKK